MPDVSLSLSLVAVHLSFVFAFVVFLCFLNVYSFVSPVVGRAGGRIFRMPVQSERRAVFTPSALHGAQRW